LFERLPEYRALLEEQWRQHVARIVELSYSAHSPADADPSDLSESRRLQETARLIAAGRQRLEETEAALARVDDRSYGLCGNCGEAIARKRLDALPAARYCASCQGRDGAGRLLVRQPAVLEPAS